MISGYISNKCIAQERLEAVQKQYDVQNSKIKAMDDPLDYVFVKIYTPNFPQMEIDRNIFCDNYTQILREIPQIHSLPELTLEHNRRMLDTLNSYKVSLGLDKILDDAEENIGDENKQNFNIKKPHEFAAMPTNPYANLTMGKTGVQGLLNQ